jgi:hypothetical protein
LTEWQKIKFSQRSNAWFCRHNSRPGHNF